MTDSMKKIYVTKVIDFLNSPAVLWMCGICIILNALFFIARMLGFDLPIVQYPVVRTTNDER